MKVKVIKAGFASYWYADRIGQEYDVVEIQLRGHEKLEYKVAGSELGGTKYFDKDDVEIINEGKQVFDIKKDGWYIATNSASEYTTAQEYLFGLGFSWYYDDATISYAGQESYGESACIVHCPGDSTSLGYSSLAWASDSNGELSEIKLTFKTVVDSVEFPELKTEEQKQLDILLAQISQLQAQAEKLQQVVNK